MHVMARVFRWLGAVLGLLIVVILAAFGLLQTRSGQAWLSRIIAHTVSSPDFSVSMQGLRGFVPFHLAVDRIEIGDRDGTYLTLHDFGLDISLPKNNYGKVLKTELRRLLANETPSA
jgi:autotransporter translocation and assembly factor TamB